MQRLAAFLLALALLAPAGASAAQGNNPQNAQAGAQAAPQAGGGTVTVIPGGSQPSAKGPAEYFTGAVRVDPLFAMPPEPPNGNTPKGTAPEGTGTRVSLANVTFEPGARTAWHTHPWGQVLMASTGYGRVQASGGPVQEIRPGDVVWIPAGVRHWHGASPTTAMTHLSIVVPVGGGSAQWGEKVTDEQYAGK